MAAAVVYEGVPNTQGETGTLFLGQKFWFSATVPQRKWFVENVEANGGVVVPLEKQADILLVDHTRKNPAPGTHSYQYVELSIRNGRLENLDDHVVGGTARMDRPVGSITMAPKGGRNPYTEADDQFLWNWVKPLEENGGAISGNAIYQQLEAVNPRHTYQSWRDRWLKYVRHQRRQVTTQVYQGDLVQSSPKRQVITQTNQENHVHSSPKRQATTRVRQEDDVNQSPKKQVTMQVHQEDHVQSSPKRQVSTQAHQEDHVQSSPKRQPLQPRTSDRVEGSPVRSSTSVAPQAPAQAVHRPPQSSADIVISRQSASPDPADRLPPLNSRGKARSRRNAEYENSGKPVFTDDNYDELFESARYILITKTEDYSRAWQALARHQAKKMKKKGKTAMGIPPRLAEEWQAYFETVVGPDYEEQLEEETGRTIEDFLVPWDTAPEGATTKVPRAEDTDDAASAESQSLKIGHGPIPSLRPESPILSTSQPASPTGPFYTTQERVPESNEARKRSAGKSTNSQDSTNSAAHAAYGDEDLSQRSTQSQKRKRDIGTDNEDDDSPSLPPFGNQEQAKRRKQSKDEPQTLEIPSTPEPERALGRGEPDDGQDLSEEAGSPTPRPRNYPERRNPDGAPSSPPSAPQTHKSLIRRWNHDPDDDQPSSPTDADEDEELPNTPRRRKEIDPNLQTSPLSVQLVSDQDPPAGSSFSHLTVGQDNDNGSLTPEFETAPEFSQVWERAQEQPGVARPDTHPLRNGKIAETQLQDWSTPPETAGSLVKLPKQPEAGDEESIVAEGESHDEEDTASEAESLETWLGKHLAAHPNADEELLIKAAGIADLDFDLADDVYWHLQAGEPVPDNGKGIWTEADDRALMGNNAKELERVEKKHGTESLVGRWHYLKQEQG